MEIYFNFSKIKILIVALTFWVFNTIAMGDANKNINEELIEAVSDQNIENLKKAIDQGADINFEYSYKTLNGGVQKFTALSMAADSGDAKLVEFLLKNGANVNGPSGFPNLPIYNAIFNNYYEIVKLIIDAGVNPNYAWEGKNGGTLLTNAAQFGNFDVVKVLLNKGADVNYTGNGDYTALYRTLIYNKLDFVPYLLDHGAKLNKKDIEALNHAWFKIDKNKKIIDLLKAKSAL